MKFLLRQHGLRYGQMTLKTQSAWGRLLQREDLAPLRRHIELHRALWTTAKDCVAVLEGELREAAAPFQQTIELLSTAPGVGPIVAATFVAIIGDPHRFASSAAVTSYLGMAPSMHDSGARQRHGAITKEGSSVMRAVLCEAAQHAEKPHHPLYPYFSRIKARGSRNNAMTAVASRLGRILWRMWLNNERFDIKRLNVIYKPRLMSKTVAYRLKSMPQAAE